MKEKKQDGSPSALGRLMEYAGRFKSLTYLSLILKIGIGKFSFHFSFRLQNSFAIHRKHRGTV